MPSGCGGNKVGRVGKGWRHHTETVTAFELDFSGQRVLVVGGSSGIGNGTARAFRGLGTQVSVWRTRAAAADHGNAPGSAAAAGPGQRD